MAHQRLLIIVLAFTLLGAACAGGSDGLSVPGTDPSSGSDPGSGLSIQPASAEVAPGGSLSLQASAASSLASAIQWSVEEGSAGGTVTAAGLYTAPSTSGAFHVVARSQANPALSGQATVTVTSTPSGLQLFVASGGNDAGPGTEAQPWRTIQKAMSAAPAGATVNIRGGTYHERLSLNVSGAAGKVITFQPYGFSGAPGCGGHTGVPCGGEAVVLDYASLGTVSDGVPFLAISGKSYVRIQGLTFQNFSCTGAMQQGVRIDGSSAFVELRNNRFLHNQNTHQAIDFTAALLHVRIWGPAHDVTFAGNEFGNIVTVVSETLTVEQSANNVTVSDNWFHDVDGIAIDTHNGAHHVTVAGNLLERIGKKADGSWWYNNPPNAIYNDGGNNVVIERNTVRDSAWAIAVVSEPGLPPGHDIVVRDNLCVGNAQGGVMLGNWYSNDGSNVYNVQVLNNTLVNNAYGFVMRPFQGPTVVWKGNLLSGNAVNLYNILGTDVGTFDYNLYAGGTAGPDAHKVTGDPRFVNAAGGDYSLQAGSPAQDAGDPAATADQVGTLDHDGRPRIGNGRVDIGAFER